MERRQQSLNGDYSLLFQGLRQPSERKAESFLQSGIVIDHLLRLNRQRFPESSALGTLSE